MEALGLKTMAGKAKVSGTFLSIGGAMLLTFYKGPQVNFLSTHINLLDLLHSSQTSTGHVAEAHHNSSNSVLGLLLALACCFSISFALIIQVIKSILIKFFFYTFFFLLLIHLLISAFFCFFF